MTRSELGALLEGASDHLAERDFVDVAWETALAHQRRRRRGWAGAGAGAVLAALAVVAIQVGAEHGALPTPAPTATSTPTGGATLADGTAYAQLPLEGRESELTYFAAGLPPAIDLDARAVPLSSGTAPRGALAAVYLRPTGPESYVPVLVPVTGRPVVADHLSLVVGPGGDPASLLGPRAIDARGRFVLFAQRDRVVRLDGKTGTTTSYAVPSDRIREVGWGADGLIVAEDDRQAWTVDPAASHPVARLSRDRSVGPLGLSMAGTGLLISRRGGATGGTEQRLRAPVTQLWGATVSTDLRAASVANFDQDLTHPVIQPGNGPIYQGLVAVDAQTGSARLLLAPESPDGQTGRLSPCCSVLGWADATTVLFTASGRHGRWVLAWKTTTGQVYEAARLMTRAPDEPVVPLAVHLDGS